MTLSSDPVVRPPLALPNFYPFAAELEATVPDEIHPSAQRTAHDYLNDAKYCAWGPEALRLVGMAAEKITQELRWHADDLDKGKRHDDADRCRREAERFEAWLSPKGKPSRWRSIYDAITQKLKRGFR
jgi:hypothetical protein